jgi:hypothetical protein
VSGKLLAKGRAMKFDKFDKGAFDIMVEHLKFWMLSSYWEDVAIESQIMFAMICECFDIEADTLVCDNLLNKLWNDAYMYYAYDEDNGREKFENFMLELMI